MARGLSFTELQRVRLLNRAITLHSKACELFELAEEIFGKDDERLLPLFGDTMCSAAELRTVIEYTDRPAAPAAKPEGE